MLLRRITKHVKDQNWFAVALDFVIVVAGILIAFQITEWNETKSAKVGLVNSLERLNNEVSLNLEISNEILKYFDDGRDDLELSRKALSNCDVSPEATAALERTFFHLTDDFQPNFVFVVLDQLARQEQYQELLSNEFQDMFGFYMRRINEEYEQLNSHYKNAWSHHVNFHPSVTALNPGSTNESILSGNSLFKLDQPFADVCRDSTFKNRFVNTVGFFSSIERRLRILTSEMEIFQSNLAMELERIQ